LPRATTKSTSASFRCPISIKKKIKKTSQKHSAGTKTHTQVSALVYLLSKVTIENAFKNARLQAILHALPLIYFSQ
jgi:hypothetical protein